MVPDRPGWVLPSRGSAEIGPVEISRIRRAESQQVADLDNALNFRQNAAVGNPLSLTVH